MRKGVIFLAREISVHGVKCILDERVPFLILALCPTQCQHRTENLKAFTLHANYLSPLKGLMALRFH